MKLNSVYNVVKGGVSVVIKLVGTEIVTVSIVVVKVVVKEGGRRVAFVSCDGQ